MHLDDLSLVFIEGRYFTVYGAMNNLHVIVEMICGPTGSKTWLGSNAGDLVFKLTISALMTNQSGKFFASQRASYWIKMRDSNRITWYPLSRKCLICSAWCTYWQRSKTTKKASSARMEAKNIDVQQLYPASSYILLAFLRYQNTWNSHIWWKDSDLWRHSRTRGYGSGCTSAQFGYNEENDLGPTAL